MSQIKKILDHLKTAPITPIEALQNYGCFRLGARIYDLRRDGYDIHTDWEEKDNKRWAKYRLISETKKW